MSAASGCRLHHDIEANLTFELFQYIVGEIEFARMTRTGVVKWRLFFAVALLAESDHVRGFVFFTSDESE